MKNTFCYIQGVVLSEDMKASDSNKNCNGCSYISFCQRDIGIVENSDQVKKMKRSRKKKESSSQGDQLSLFGDEDVIGFADVVNESSEDVNENVFDKSIEGFELNLDDADFGLGNYVTDDELLEARTAKIGEDIIVAYDGWIVEREEDVMYVTDGKYGIDLSDELPYFTVDELASLGRFRSKYWN